jgi:NADPH2:quinone reductase
VDEPEAAAAPLVYLTAYQSLTQFGELPPGQIVLITGASGGVGVASIHLARAMGHTVVAMSRGDGKVDALMKLGRQRRPRSERIRPGGRSSRDSPAASAWAWPSTTSAGRSFPRVLDSLDHNGKIACVGRLAGPVPQFNTASLFFRRITIKGVHVGDFTRRRHKRVGRDAETS